MAGSFGYDRKKYRTSMAIAELKLFPALRASPEKLVCAHGFSCRHQIHDGLDRHARHPAELLDQHWAARFDPAQFRAVATALR